MARKQAKFSPSRLDLMATIKGSLKLAELEQPCIMILGDRPSSQRPAPLAPAVSNGEPTTRSPGGPWGRPRRARGSLREHGTPFPRL